jgi:Ni,Fe-hydrogenase III small subunit
MDSREIEKLIVELWKKARPTKQDVVVHIGPITEEQSKELIAFWNSLPDKPKNET